MSAKSDAFTLWRGNDYLTKTSFSDPKTAYTHGYYCGMNEHDAIIWDEFNDKHGITLRYKDREMLQHLDYAYYEWKGNKIRVIFKEHMPLCHTIPSNETVDLQIHWLEGIIDSIGSIKYNNIVIKSLDHYFMSEIEGILKNLRIRYKTSSRPLYKHESNCRGFDIGQNCHKQSGPLTRIYNVPDYNGGFKDGITDKKFLLIISRSELEKRNFYCLLLSGEE